MTRARTQASVEPAQPTRRAWFRRAKRPAPAPPPAIAPLLAAAPPRIHVMRFDRGAIEEFEPERMSQVRDLLVEGKTTWINVNGLSDEGMADTLRDLFGIHPLTLEDVFSHQHRAKFEEYPSYLLVVMQMLKQESGSRFDMEQVSILLGDGWLLTIQEGKPGDVFGPVREALRLGRPTLRSSGPDHLLAALLSAIVGAAFPILEGFGARAEQLEDRILEGAGIEVREGLQDLKRDLLTVRRMAWPQREVLASLERDELRQIKHETRPFLRDVHDMGVRVMDFVEVNRELVASLMDLYLANTTQKTNEVMKVLTIVATIFIPLTFITSLYGMNFQYMPELHERWAYPAVLSFMAVTAGAMLLYFRRRQWI